MSKKIEFEYADKSYTLEYNRKTLEKMEDEGIVLSELSNKPVTILPRLFQYAFTMHHNGIAPSKINEMYNLFTDKQGLVTVLSEMAVDALNSLFEEPTSKNAIKWKTNS